MMLFKANFRSKYIKTSLASIFLVNNFMNHENINHSDALNHFDLKSTLAKCKYSIKMKFIIHICLLIELYTGF